VAAPRIAITIAWVAFWAYWLGSARNVKSGSRSRRARPPGLVAVVALYVLLRLLGWGSPGVHSVPLEAIGSIAVAAGLGLAVWARVHLGRNWGMPMTKKDEPELVTSGPYRVVRHPIYSGILLALLGTALATNLLALVLPAAVGAYFVHSGRVEEGLMSASFPATYASYKAKTKMLIPFVF
jgi:protein-S-isoprenylcysteine O-methyltransferase Ste14